MRDLTKVKGTIAYHFNQNIDLLFSCGDDVEKMRSISLQLLEDKDLTDNKAVNEAKAILSTVPTFKFCSVLGTYLTGIRV